MVFFPASSKFLMALRKLCFAIPAIFLLTTACVQVQHDTVRTSPVNEKYSTDSLAKDWHDQVRKNPNNPYEGYSYPSDNDSDYYYPTRRVIKNTPKPQQRQQTPVYKNAPPIYDNDDSNYGRFPKYNPDDDNQVIDSKNFPLYLD